MSIHGLNPITQCPSQQIAKVEVKVYLEDSANPIEGIHMKLKMGDAELNEGETNRRGTKRFTILYTRDRYSVHLPGDKLNGIYKDAEVKPSNSYFNLMPGRTKEVVFNVYPVITLLKLHLMRGGEPRKGNCQVIVEDDGKRKLFESPPLNIQDGYLEVAIPRLYADRASIAKLYYLNRRKERTGEALLLHIGEKREVTEPSVASRYLRAMGFFEKEPLAENIVLAANPQAKLDLDLGLASYQRSYEAETIQMFENAQLEKLEQDYWNPD